MTEMIYHICNADGENAAEALARQAERCCARTNSGGPTILTEERLATLSHFLAAREK
jgi:hypothetical protein